MKIELTISHGAAITIPNDSSLQYVANRVGYDFKGVFTGQNGTGTQYFGYEIAYWLNDYYYKLNSYDYSATGALTLYAYWTIIDVDFEYLIVDSNDGTLVIQKSKVHMTHNANVTITAPTISGYTFSQMWVNGTYYTTTSHTITAVQLKRNLGYGIDGYEDSEPVWLWYPSYGSSLNGGGLFMVYTKECVAEGTLITLADGTQRAVEDLTGEEMLLVWNLHTGTFDSAPILFVDSDPIKEYKVINLTFSDGTIVKVIGEHAFWDFDLNR